MNTPYTCKTWFEGIDGMFMLSHAREQVSSAFPPRGEQHLSGRVPSRLLKWNRENHKKWSNWCVHDHRPGLILSLRSRPPGLIAFKGYSIKKVGRGGQEKFSDPPPPTRFTFEDPPPLPPYFWIADPPSPYFGGYLSPPPNSTAQPPLSRIDIPHRYTNLIHIA